MTERLSEAQVTELLKPLSPSRVSKKQGKFSYLEAYDVKVHLIKHFGFAGFSAEVIGMEILSREKGERNWDVSALGTVRLYIADTGAVYTECAVGSAHLPDLGEALDMAVKTAESDALKRAAVYLGDQYGISLYNNGSTAATVVSTAVDEVPEAPVSEITQQVTQAAAEAKEADDLAVQNALDEIRVAAVIPDSAQRIEDLARIAAHYPAVLLTRMTQVKGSDVSLKVLIDRASAGEFVPAEKVEA